MTKEICENERQSKEIEALKGALKTKDDELNKIKSQKPKKDNKQYEEDVLKLTQKLEETRDLCLEYNHRMETMKKQNKEEVNKISIEKMKLEDELRSAILEKNLFRDSERILLNTFDTLKMHYDAKKNTDGKRVTLKMERKRMRNSLFVTYATTKQTKQSI